MSDDHEKLRALQRAMDDLARTGGTAQTDIARGVGQEVRGVLKDEFATGQGPDGSWPKTVQGKQALDSRKIPSTIKAKPIEGGVGFSSKISWLLAQHAGHTWPARNAGGQSLFFDERGKLLKLGKLSAARMRRITFVQEKVTRAHVIGERVLPAHPIYPEHGMPAAWAGAIERGAQQGMQRWFERAAGK